MRKFTSLKKDNISERNRRIEIVLSDEEFNLLDKIKKENNCSFSFIIRAFINNLEKKYNNPENNS